MKKILWIILFSVFCAHAMLPKPSFVVTVPHVVPFSDDGYESDVDESLICSERVYSDRELKKVKGRF